MTSLQEISKARAWEVNVSIMVDKNFSGNLSDVITELVRKKL
jgi:hypothetical protein